MVLMTAATPFSIWLSERMRRRGLNQSALATYLGTSSSTVNAWLNRGATPSRKLAASLAAYFNVEPSQIERLIAGVQPGSSSLAEQPSPYDVVDLAEATAIARALHGDERGWRIWIEVGRSLIQTQDQEN